MKNVTDLHRLLRWPVLALLIGLLVAGCDAEEAAQPPIEDATIGLQLRGLNYSGVPVGVFYVNDKWGGNVNMYAGGGSTAGSIGLPKKWRAGLQVTIKWQNDLLYAKDKKALHTDVMDIAPYGEMLQGQLWVAFLPNDQLQVYVSNYGPGHLKFPNRELINPREYCLIRPECHATYYPHERVPELWEVYSPFRLSDPPTEAEKQKAMELAPELKTLDLKP